MQTSKNDRGSQSLEFALISPLIMGAVALVLMAGVLAHAILMTYGVAQTTARQLSLNGTATPPAPYVMHVDPPHPKEGDVFYVHIQRPISLPLPGKPEWTIEQRVWGVRAPIPGP